METILLALSALQTLVRNPRLGGGGLKSEETALLMGHLITLIQGGAKTAAALKAFAEEIKVMAETGYQPVQRDFDRFTARLDTALAVIAEAKEQLKQETEVDDDEAEDQIEEALEEAKKPDPVESPALAALDTATVAHEAEPAPTETVEPEPPEPEQPSRRTRNRR